MQTVLYSLLLCAFGAEKDNFVVDVSGQTWTFRCRPGRDSDGERVPRVDLFFKNSRAILTRGSLV